MCWQMKIRTNGDDDRPALSKVFASTFARWAVATTLNFTEAASASDVDITIGFHAGVHRTAGHACARLLAYRRAAPPGRLGGMGGRRRRVVGVAGRADLESMVMVVHQIGHPNGFGHFLVEDAIMYLTIMSHIYRRWSCLTTTSSGSRAYTALNIKGLTPSAMSSVEFQSGAAGVRSADPLRGAAAFSW